MVTNHTQKISTELELQCIEAFDYLIYRFHAHITSATFHAYLKEQIITRENLLLVMQKAGHNCGFHMRKMIVVKEDFALTPVGNFFAFYNGQLIWVEEATIDKVRYIGFHEKREQGVFNLDSLFGVNKSLKVLFCEGLSSSFMTDEDQGAPVKKDHSNFGGHDHHQSHDHHDDPGHVVKLIINRLQRMWKDERKDFYLVISYAVITGVMSLVVPLSASAIVNAITLGVFTTQLVVLCVVVAIGLLFVGFFQVLQRYVVDIIQRRIFVRTTFEIAHRLPRIKHTALLGEYTPEVINRFFDILTIQKSIGKFFLDGVSSLLVTAIGLILLAIYHPFFLIFNITLFIFLPVLVLLLGRGGLMTSIAESRRKYAIASWLEEIARCQKSFKLFSTPEFVYERIDAHAIEYVRARHDHFKVLMRQIAGSVAFRAFATVGILGIGGSLVIERQLTIGELVAAELVLVSMLSAIEKLIEQFEMHYDLFTAIDKVSHITDKPIEAVGGEYGPDFDTPIDVRMENVSLISPTGKPILRGIDLHVRKGENISLVGESGSGKTALVSLLVGMQDSSNGTIEFNDYDISRMDRQRVRSITGIVMEDNQIFDGTVEENILLGRPHSYYDLEWALEVSQLHEEIRRIPKGLKSPLLPNGLNVSVSFARRLMFARAIVGRPRLLILDESFTGVEERIKLAIIDGIYSDMSWTVINISHDAELLQRSDRIYMLDQGKLIENYSPSELLQNPESKIVRLFPELTRIIADKLQSKSLVK